MIKSLRLPFEFEPAALLRDLEKISPEAWIPHFNQSYYDGEWSGTALRGPADAIHPIQSLIANPGTTSWANIPLLERCEAFQHVLDTFRCPLLSVRLLRLAPGSVIKEHTDHSLGFEDGELRLHVPIQTHPEVDFFLDGERLQLLAGQTWYVNVNFPHRVVNRGTEARVHLVADCVVNDWMRSIFHHTPPRKQARTRPPSPRLGPDLT